MPEDRLQRTKATLPEGYQFGDARGVLVNERCGIATMDGNVTHYVTLPMWRHPSENFAEQLARTAHTQSADDID